MLDNDALARSYRAYVQSTKNAIEDGEAPEDTEIMSWTEFYDKYIDFCHEVE